MDIKGKTPAGQTLKVPQGYRTYVPNPLPPEFTWNTALITELSEANHIMGKLSRESSYLPNPHLLIRPFVAREAVSSSKIEGTQATLGEILANDAGGEVNSSPDDLKEVSNYILALEYGIEQLRNSSLSLKLIQQLHARLMQGVRGEHATPGLFRTVQNWIGTRGCTPATAKYVPPPPTKLIGCLATFENYLQDRKLPALIHIALCHYQFEAIHPFLDGNGRLGRLLITLLLLEHKMLASPLLYLSAFFEASRAEYYRHLHDVSAVGNWNEWLHYFLNGIINQSSDVLSRAERINQLLTNWKIKTGGNVASLPMDIIDQLAVNPFLSAKRVASQFKVAFTTAQRAIQKLESLKIIKQVDNKMRDRFYCATEVLAILEEPADIAHNTMARS
jgi:Fic family protein